MLARLWLLQVPDGMPMTKGVELAENFRGVLKRLEENGSSDFVAAVCDRFDVRVINLQVPIEQQETRTPVFVFSANSDKVTKQEVESFVSEFKTKILDGSYEMEINGIKVLTVVVPPGITLIKI